MSIQRKKKPVEFHFVDMNDPDRYKKLKVARACDFCRRRKSKCDIGVPGSGTCSNCQKYKMVCIFSPVQTQSLNKDVSCRIEEATSFQKPVLLNLMDQLQFRFSLILIKDGQVGYEKYPYKQPQLKLPKQQLNNDFSNEPSLEIENLLFQLYFDNIHYAFPILLKQSILNIHSQDRFLLSRPLRFSIMTLGLHFYNSASNKISNFTNMIKFFYETSKQEISNIISNKSIQPRLDTIQSLLLLYKHNEISNNQNDDVVQFLESAQELINKINSIVPQQQEMINRARWILFSLIGLSNLADKRFNSLYSNINLPNDLPQLLNEELENDDNSQQHINRFSQLSNLSVLYSHTIQNLIINSTSQLICFDQFQEIRQHWHNSLHPITQNRLVCSTDQDEIDILILYTAILYDMLYLLLILHQNRAEIEWDAIDTSYRLHRMVHTWVLKPAFISAIQCRRMASFALMISLQVQLKRDEDKIDCDFIDRIRKTLQLINIDPRIDNELKELCIQLVNKKSSYSFSGHSSASTFVHHQSQAVDYFSLVVPPHSFISTPSSPMDHPSASTPGLWDILSTTTNGGVTTPIREETNYLNDYQTNEWVVEQQRQQQQQFQLYLHQQQNQSSQQFQFTNNPLQSSQFYLNNPPASNQGNSENENKETTSNQDNWSHTTIEHLNQMKI